MTVPIPPWRDLDEGEDDLAPASGDHDMVRLPGGGAGKMTGSAGPVRE